MPFVGLDWRSPGDKWIRTEFGWKRLVDVRASIGAQLVSQLRNLRRVSPRVSPKQLSRKTSPTGEGESGRKRSQSPTVKNTEQPSSSQPTIEARLAFLNHILAQRCVSARTSSRESNQYTTISDAVNKLNFAQALYDENCFPLVCKVVTLLFQEQYWNISGTLQSTLLRICDAAKEITMSTKKHSGLVLKLMGKAITALESGRKHQFSVFATRNIDSKIKTLLKSKRQLQHSLLQSYVMPSHLSCDLSSLPGDCLREVIGHLADPRDVLSFGQTNKRLYSLTHENWVWRDLTHYHYGPCNSTHSEELSGSESCPGDGEGNSSDTSVNWKHVFRREYKSSKRRLQGEVSYALCLCSVCSFVYWKSYGHPCCHYASGCTDTVCSQDSNCNKDISYLTAENFLALFAS